MQTIKTTFIESSSPLRNDLRAHLKTPSDLHVGQTLSRVQDDLRALHIAIRQRQLRCPALQHRLLLLAERDLDRERHQRTSSPPRL
jgi:hypothetical protein